MSVPLKIERNGTAWVFAINMTALGGSEDGATVTAQVEYPKGTPLPGATWPLSLTLVSDPDVVAYLAEHGADATLSHYGGRVTGVSTWPPEGKFAWLKINASTGSDSRESYDEVRVVTANGGCE